MKQSSAYIVAFLLTDSEALLPAIQDSSGVGAGEAAVKSKANKVNVDVHIRLNPVRMTVHV